MQHASPGNRAGALDKRRARTSGDIAAGVPAIASPVRHALFRSPFAHARSDTSTGAHAKRAAWTPCWRNDGGIDRNRTVARAALGKQRN